MPLPSATKLAHIPEREENLRQVLPDRGIYCAGSFRNWFGPELHLGRLSDYFLEFLLRAPLY